LRTLITFTVLVYGVGVVIATVYHHVPVPVTLVCCCCCRCLLRLLFPGSLLLYVCSGPLLFYLYVTFYVVVCHYGCCCCLYVCVTLRYAFGLVRLFVTIVVYVWLRFDYTVCTLLLTRYC
jgi:hypothetical protein